MADDNKVGQMSDEGTTSIDSLVKLLRAKGKLELSKVAEQLDVSPSLLDNWAKVLEQNNIIKISYELGKMYLSPVSKAEEDAKMVSARAEVKRDVIAQSLSTQLVELNNFASALSNVNISVSNAETLYKEKFPEIQRLLEQVNKVYDTVEEKNRSIASMKKQTTESYEAVARRFSQLESKINDLSKLSSSQPVENMRKVGELSKSISSVVVTINSLERSKAKQMEELKKGLRAQFDLLASEIDKESLTLDLTLKTYRSQLMDLSKETELTKSKYENLKHFVNDFEKDKARIEASLRASSTAFDDAYQKERQELERRADAYDEISDSLKEKITNLKAQFGDASRLVDSIRSTKAQMQEVEKQIDASRTEIIKMLNEIKALPTLTNLTPAQKAAIVENLSQNENTSRRKITKMRDNVRSTIQKLNDIGEESK
jgi:DNA-binding transcriptional ArsR family regulator/uncharacterized protein YukE